MFRLTSLSRAIAVLSLVLGGAALAQPANNLCAGAEALTFAGNSALSASVSAVGATYTPTGTPGEPALSCRSSPGGTVWYTFVPPQTANYRIGTCGTTTNYDTVLAVYQGTGCGGLTEVTGSCSDDDCGRQSSSTLTLTAGTTYWVQVAAFGTSTITSTSVVQLSVTFAATPSNESCSGATPVSPSSTGGTVVTAPVTAIGYAVSPPEVAPSCSTSAENDVWYAFSPPVSGLYRVDTCGVTNNVNTVLALYTGTCGGLTAVANSCNDDGSCTPSTSSSVLLNLVQGTTYYAQVSALSSNTNTITAASTTGLNITYFAPPPNDTCSSPQPLSLNRATAFSITAGAQNDSQVGGILDGGSQVNNCYSGYGHYTTVSLNQAPGRDVVFSFSPPATSLYNIRLTPTSSSNPNSVLYLTDSCTAATTPPQTYAPPQCIAAANRSGGSTATSGEELSCVPLNASSPYFVWADETVGSTSDTTYEVEVTVCNRELEPNGTPATANALSCPMTGSVADAGTAFDVDFFALGTNPGARVFALVDAHPSSTAGTSATDYDLRVTTDTDTLEYDNDNADGLFGSSSANVSGAILPNAPAYLRVNYGSTTTAREPYRLYSVVQPGPAIAEQEPNDAPAQAFAGPANYFIGDTADANDIDLYAFEARAGDLVFLSLDSNPSRDTDGGTSTANQALALLNVDGGVLLTVNDSSTTITTTVTPGSLTATGPASPSEGLTYRVRADGTYLARVSRSVTSGKNAYLLSVATNCSVGGGIGAPTASGVSPTTGTISGGTPALITGTGFNPLTTVTVGGAAATVVARTSTTLNILTPPGSEGPATIVVTNPGGQQVSLTGFSYFAPVEPPTVTGVSPLTGPTAGGTVLTVTGTLFKPGAEVSFTVGGVTVSGLNVEIVNPATLRVTTPPQSPGLATITVRNPVDDLSGSRADAFTFLAPPFVSSIVPNEGPSDGGQTVTIEGEWFRSGATVRIGGTLATGVNVFDGGFSLTAVTPASAVNTAVDVIVRNADGQDYVFDGGYRYFWPAPLITSLSPVRGIVDGGTTITLTGQNFQPAPVVTVGGVPATSVNRVSLTSVTAVTPAGTPGLAPVTITNSDSKSATLDGGFLYLGWPTIASVNPNRGFSTGGELVTITGSDFRAPTTVLFGTTAGTSVTVADGGASLTVLTPVVSVNVPVSVTVQNTDTNQSVTLPNAYTFEWRAPTITAVAPNQGYTDGGTSFTITGTGFQAGVSVTVGGTPTASATRSGTTSITAVTRAGPAGPADVVVTNTDGKSATLTNGFRFVPPPQLVSVSPSHGPMQGGTLITVTGQDFLPGAVLRIGGVPAFAVNVTSPTTATAVTNAGASGPADVVLINPDLQSSTLPMAFTYDSAPTITAVSPLTASTAGGTPITITGTNFLSGASVFFGPSASPTVTFVSATELTAVTPARAAGVVSVTVRNPDGQAAELPRAFRFVAPPMLSSASPATGDVHGGTAVRIQGSGFTVSSLVRFGTSPAMTVSFISATELEAITPAHAPGAVDIVVSNDGAEATLTNAFTYTRGAPTLTAVAPVSGPIAGGTLLTLSGSGFAPGATVTVGGSPATDIVVVSEVLVRAVAPAHAAGAVDVVITNDDAQAATLANAYTYVAPMTGEGGTVVDGGSGSLGEDPVVEPPVPGGVSCGCSSFDASSFSLAGFGLLMVLSRRRRRS